MATAAGEGGTLSPTTATLGATTLGATTLGATTQSPILKHTVVLILRNNGEKVTQRGWLVSELTGDRFIIQLDADYNRHQTFSKKDFLFIDAEFTNPSDPDYNNFIEFTDITPDGGTLNGTLFTPAGARPGRYTISTRDLFNSDNLYINLKIVTANNPINPTAPESPILFQPSAKLSFDDFRDQQEFKSYDHFDRTSSEQTELSDTELWIKVQAKGFLNSHFINESLIDFRKLYLMYTDAVTYLTSPSVSPATSITSASSAATVVNAPLLNNLDRLIILYLILVYMLLTSLDYNFLAFTKNKEVTAERVYTILKKDLLSQFKGGELDSLCRSSIFKINPSTNSKLIGRLTTADKLLRTELFTTTVAFKDYISIHANSAQPVGVGRTGSSSDGSLKVKSNLSFEDEADEDSDQEPEPPFPPTPKDDPRAPEDFERILKESVTADDTPLAFLAYINDPSHQKGETFNAFRDAYLKVYTARLEACKKERAGKTKTTTSDTAYQTWLAHYYSEDGKSINTKVFDKKLLTLIDAAFKRRNREAIAAGKETPEITRIFEDGMPPDAPPEQIALAKFLDGMRNKLIYKNINGENVSTEDDQGGSMVNVKVLKKSSSAKGGGGGTVTTTLTSTIRGSKGIKRKRRD